MKAEKLFKDVIEREISKGRASNDNSIIEMSLKLACIYSEWKQDDKAGIGFRHCIQEQEKKIKAGRWEKLMHTVQQVNEFILQAMLMKTPWPCGAWGMNTMHDT